MTGAKTPNFLLLRNRDLWGDRGEVRTRPYYLGLDSKALLDEGLIIAFKRIEKRSYYCFQKKETNLASTRNTLHESLVLSPPQVMKVKSKRGRMRQKSFLP